MTSPSYKTCSAPMCRSTTIKYPSKLFIHVSKCPKIRKRWFQLARRHPATTSNKSTIYFCEDHFDLPRDMENYMEYTLMGSVKKIRMKPNCLPSKFECQPGRFKRTMKPRSSTVKRQRLSIVKELITMNKIGEPNTSGITNKNVFESAEKMYSVHSQTEFQPFAQHSKVKQEPFNRNIDGKKAVKIKNEFCDIDIYNKHVVSNEMIVDRSSNDIKPPFYIKDEMEISANLHTKYVVKNEPVEHFIKDISVNLNTEYIVKDEPVEHYIKDETEISANLHTEYAVKEEPVEHYIKDEMEISATLHTEYVVKDEPVEQDD